MLDSESRIKDVQKLGANERRKYFNIETLIFKDLTHDDLIKNISSTESLAHSA